MKPKNFPGRKNQRRISALQRTKNPDEITILNSKIVSPEAARLIKSKKDRTPEDQKHKK